jgi:hypothetical protein
LYDTVNGQDIWKPMPQTYYFSDGGELDLILIIQDLMLILSANFSLNTVPLVGHKKRLEL